MKRVRPWAHAPRTATSLRSSSQTRVGQLGQEAVEGSVPRDTPMSQTQRSDGQSIALSGGGRRVISIAAARGNLSPGSRGSSGQSSRLHSVRGAGILYAAGAVAADMDVGSLSPEERWMQEDLMGSTTCAIDGAQSGWRSRLSMTRRGKKVKRK